MKNEDDNLTLFDSATSQGKYFLLFQIQKLWAVLTLFSMKSAFSVTFSLRKGLYIKWAKKCGGGPERSAAEVTWLGNWAPGAAAEPSGCLRCTGFISTFPGGTPLPFAPGRPEGCNLHRIIDYTVQGCPDDPLFRCFGVVSVWWEPQLKQRLRKPAPAVAHCGRLRKRKTGGPLV